MKKLITSFSVFFIAFLCFAQSPESFKYQAVVRNTDGTIVKNQNVSFKMEILQGSAYGSAVYTETHVKSTDSYGLVHLDVGSGTTANDFSSIGWGTNEYFLQVSLDLSGGSTYVILGTSQLLSVPYAMHATTAETLTGTLPETDPLYSASEAANITAADITKLGNLSGTNTGDQDLSALATQSALEDTASAIRDDIPLISGGGEINVQSDWTESDAGSDAYILNKPVLSPVATSGDYGDLNNLPVTDGSETMIEAGDGIEVSGTGTIADPYIIAETEAHYVGELYGGGIVFYTWQNGQHGLIASLSTLSLMSNQADAIALCASFGDGGNNDWYLPGVEECKQLFNSSFIINKILANDGDAATTELDNTQHWTSSEATPTQGYMCNYSSFDIASFTNSPVTALYHVRAVREF